MIVLGLTGSIGMGKSSTSSMFYELGIPVYDADAAVHQIYDVGGSAVRPVQELFPDVVVENRIDRNRLREIVLNNSQNLVQLERIVHPLVRDTQLAFRAQCEKDGADIVVLDIPLLFETGGDKNVDHIIVVTTTAEEQRNRVLARPGMTEEAFKVILSKQIPDTEKRKRADFIINARIDFDYTREQVKALISALRRMN